MSIVFFGLWVIVLCIGFVVTRTVLSGIDEKIGHVVRRVDWSQEARDDLTNLVKREQKWYRIEDVILAAVLVTVAVLVGFLVLR
jgi:cation transport ATPase